MMDHRQGRGIILLSTYSFSESKVSADKCQRNWHAEPKSEQCDQSAEWNSAGTSFAPEHNVHDKEQRENGSEIAKQNSFKAPQIEKQVVPLTQDKASK